jgi:hypothetical protein
MATLIKANGTLVEVQPADSKSFTLEEMQKLVGGYIEYVYLANGGQAVINEDGHLRHLPPNAKATVLLANNANYIKTWIVGDVLVGSREELGLE